jgi:hypothetical protein
MIPAFSRVEVPPGRSSSYRPVNDVDCVFPEDLLYPVDEADGVDGVRRRFARLELGVDKGAAGRAQRAVPFAVVPFLDKGKKPGEDRADIPHEPGVSLAVAVDFPGIDIDPDDLRERRDDAARHEKPVEPDSRRDDKVGLRERRQEADVPTGQIESGWLSGSSPRP